MNRTFRLGWGRGAGERRGPRAWGHSGDKALWRAFPFTVLVVLWAGDVQAAAGARTREALAQVRPPYDPSARDRNEPSPADVPGIASASTEPEVPENQPPPSPGVITLAPVIVERMRPPVKSARAPIPQVVVEPPVKRVPVDAFDTPETLRAKTVERRLSAFDRFFLNRFKLPLLGQSLESRAMAIEAEAARAQQLNQLARMIDLLEATEGNTDEVREMRKLYAELYMARSR